jgi:hypothetical protein
MEEVLFDQASAVAVIRAGISQRGYYFVAGPHLERLMDSDGSPAEKLRWLQTFAITHGWRVITRDQCTIAMFLPGLHGK